MNKDEVMREYFAAQGRKGGSVKGKCKARKLSREHYAKTGQAVRSYWENWRKVNGRTKGKRGGSVRQTEA